MNSKSKDDLDIKFIYSRKLWYENSTKKELLIKFYSKLGSFTKIMVQKITLNKI